MIRDTLEREVVLHRYYDPATGQFVSSDPLVDLTGQPYAYVGGDPVNSRDPSGLCDVRTGDSNQLFVHLYNGACTGEAATELAQRAAAASAQGASSNGCSIWEPWSGGSCFRQGWEQMPGWAQLADATLPITLPLSVLGVGEFLGAAATSAAAQAFPATTLAATGLDGVCRLEENAATSPAQKAAWHRAGAILQDAEIGHLLSGLLG